MARIGSFGFLAAAFAATLAGSSGFTAEALAAQSSTQSATPSAPTVLSARLDPCMSYGYGCAKGYSDGYNDGGACRASDSGRSPDSGQPDYLTGYNMGYAAGRKAFHCDEESGGGTSPREKLRRQGYDQGLADARAFHRCMKANYRDMPKPFRRGYKKGNYYC